MPLLHKVKHTVIVHIFKSIFLDFLLEFRFICFVIVDSSWMLNMLNEHLE